MSTSDNRSPECSTVFEERRAMQQADEDIEREVAQQPGGMRTHIAVPSG